MAQEIDIGRELTKILDGYSHEVIKAVEHISAEVAKDTVEYLKSENVGGYKNRRRRKNYRKSFRTKNADKGFLNAQNIIYNTQWQLTHLLEHGHAIHGGTERTRAFPHWDGAEKYAIKELQNRIKEVLSR